MAKPKYRISSETYKLMMAVAVVFDVGTAIMSLTVVGAVPEFLLTLVMGGVLWLWFKIKGVSLISTRRWKGKVFNFLVELIPYLDIIWPGWILLVRATYKAAREEDEEKAKAKTKQEESVVMREQENKTLAMSSREAEYENVLSGSAEEEVEDEDVRRKKRKRLAPGVGLENVPRFAGLEEGTVTRPKRGRGRAKPSLREERKVA